MTNIVWRQPSQTLAVTSILDGSDPTEHAALLQSRGDVPADWEVAALNVGEFPEGPQEAWRFVGGVIVRDAAAATALARVAMVVSRRQIRQAMSLTPYQAGTLREAVEAAVAAGDQNLQDWWNDANEFERLHPVVVAMAQALGQSDEQVDTLFTLAASL
jgi:hypothetical protein